MLTPDHDVCAADGHPPEPQTHGHAHGPECQPNRSGAPQRHSHGPGLCAPHVSDKARGEGSSAATRMAVRFMTMRMPLRCFMEALSFAGEFS
ncbi:hypothetical protein DB31_1196 [Hyalangium minutum]|uniref:Uncharacterized protein n=1 Tax=Hyalangium minutum TaxID=394096 RepID=A0A085WEL8_9BACT|nr:hypothetical protein DB31_1196 [Hyalangium minutum]